MGVYCPKCGEPWESESIHDEVAKRFPNKPWYVEDKPERSEKADTITPWCAFIIGKYDNNLPKMCSERKSHALHNSVEYPVMGHEFTPQVQKEYRTYNSNPFVDRNTGLWYDDLIYEQHYEPVLKEFQVNGCAAFGMPHNTVENRKIGEVANLAYEMMGDDMDGAQSMLEDAEYMGLFE